MKLTKILFCLIIFLLIGCKKVELGTLEDNYYFDKKNNSNLVIKCSGIKSVAYFTIDDETYTFFSYSKEAITISSTHLSKFSLGSYEATLKINSKIFSFTLHIIDGSTPYLLSDDFIEYEDNDIIIKFNLFSGSIKSISGEFLTDDDYLIEDNIITIFASCIERSGEELNYLEYTLSYRSEDKDLEISGTITIKKIIFGEIIW